MGPMVGEQPELAEHAPRPRHSGGRGHAWLLVVVGLLVVGLLAAGFALGDEGGPEAAPSTSATPSATPTPTIDASVLRVQALDELLAERGRAMLARDREAWLATVDPASTDFADNQGAVFDNLAQVPLEVWRYEFAGEGPGLAADRQAALGPEAWVARVVLVYRLADADQSDVRREAYLTLARDGDDWLVTGDTDGTSSTELWDLGPVNVVRGSRSLVLGTADADSLQQYVDEVDDAAERVDEVWGSEWPRTVVVQVPRDQTEMSELLLRKDEEGLEQIAAVTTGELGLDQPGTSADRVIVNPAGFAQLGPLGREVVLTHEITHVATRATTTTDVPIWLSEGFADYVAYADTGLSRDVVAADVLDAVRAGDGPTSLPTDPDFDPALTDIAAAYSGSWLAAELISRTYSEEALVAFYRAVAGGFTPGSTPSSNAVDPSAPSASPSVVEVAFDQVLGTDQAAFEQSWVQYLADLAG